MARMIQSKNTVANVPHLMREWHWERNQEKSPEATSIHSRKRVWWKGLCHHEWEAIVENRYRGTGCPYCANQKVLVGFNDLASQCPEIAREWHPIKNQGLTAQDILMGSTKRVWWQCAFGHEWQTSPLKRTQPNSQNNCPYCSGKKVWVGFNDLATTHPHLANEWHPTLNELNPTEVSGGSARPVWWLGKCGHEWESKVINRAKYLSGCPYCSGKKVLAGFNDLATTHPELVKEWHPTLNELKPTEVSSGSEKKMWWICRNHHVWQSRVFVRSGTKKKHGAGCPVCVKEMVSRSTKK